jgi:hypothetical protein
MPGVDMGRSGSRLDQADHRTTRVLGILAFFPAEAVVLLSAFVVAADTKFGDDRFWLPSLLIYAVGLFLVPLGWFACLRGTRLASWISLGCAAAIGAVALRVAAPLLVWQDVPALRATHSDTERSGEAFLCFLLVALPGWLLLIGLLAMQRDRARARPTR